MMIYHVLVPYGLQCGSYIGFGLCFLLFFCVITLFMFIY